MRENLARWTRRPDVIEYVIECYVGTEKQEGSKPRRVFIWEDGNEIKMGNTTSFTAHCCERFGLLRADPSEVHALLRALGETIAQHKPHGPRIGKTGWKAPEPDEWVVGHINPVELPDEPE